MYDENDEDVNLIVQWRKIQIVDNLIFDFENSNDDCDDYGDLCCDVCDSNGVCDDFIDVRGDIYDSNDVLITILMCKGMYIILTVHW